MINENTIFIIVILLSILFGVFITGIIFFAVYEHYLKKQEQYYETKLEELEDELSCVCEDLFKTQSAHILFYRDMSEELERVRQRNFEATQKGDTSKAYTAFTIANLCIYCDRLASKYATTDPEDYKDELLKF